MSWGFRRQGDAGGAVLAADTAARLADDFVESYVSWREASEAVRTAYERWRAGQRPDRGLAFSEYRAALDREEHAAVMFHERATLVWSPWE
jgi:hypothetical protein